MAHVAAASGRAYFLPYLSSYGIQMAALGRTSTPFCFVIRQFLGFFPGQVCLRSRLMTSTQFFLGRPDFSCNLSVPSVLPDFEKSWATHECRKMQDYGE